MTNPKLTPLDDKKTTLEMQAMPGVVFTVVYAEDFAPISDFANEYQFKDLEDAERVADNFATEDHLAVLSFPDDGSEYYRSEENVWERYA